MNRHRWIAAFCILAATGVLLWWVPPASSLLYGSSQSEPMTGISILVVLAATTAAGMLARRLPWWARGALCAAVAAVIVTLWPHPGLSDFGWAVLWSIFSGALLIAVAGGFMFGLTLRQEQDSPPNLSDERRATQT